MEVEEPTKTVHLDENLNKNNFEIVSKPIDENVNEEILRNANQSLASVGTIQLSQIKEQVQSTKTNVKKRGKVKLAYMSNIKSRTKTAKARGKNLVQKAHELAILTGAKVTVTVEYNGGKNTRFDWQYPTEEIKSPDSIIVTTSLGSTESVTLYQGNDPESENSNSKEPAQTVEMQTDIVPQSEPIKPFILRLFEENFQELAEKMTKHIDESIKNHSSLTSPSSNENLTNEISVLHALSPKFVAVPRVSGSVKTTSKSNSSNSTDKLKVLDTKTKRIRRSGRNANKD